MLKQYKNSKRGFTIIEVVLVLAIAGLIFLMVFLALPALQRSQRDTQRSDDIARLQTAIINYQTNNRGKIPTDTNDVAGHDVKQASGTYSTGTWGYFYDNYILVGSAGNTDTFADPNGDPYSLKIYYCAGSATAKLSAGAECAASVQRNTIDFDSQSEGTTDKNGSSIDLTISDTLTQAGTGVKSTGFSIGIVLNATCQDELAVASTGTRKVAILYKKEGGGAICLNN